MEPSDGFRGQNLSLGHNFSPGGECLGNVCQLFEKFISRDHWKCCDTAQQMCSLQPASSVHVDDYLTSEQNEHDPARIRLRAASLGGQLCAAIPISSAEIKTIVFQGRMEGAFKNACGSGERG